MSSRTQWKSLGSRKSTKNNNSISDWKITDKCLTPDRTSEEQPCFQSVLLTSDDSSDDDAIENASYKLTADDVLQDSDENHTFVVTESDDISPSPLISKTSNKRITFNTDNLSICSSGNDEVKRRICYSKSPHSNKFNQQYTLDDSIHLSPNLIDSKDSDYPGASKGEVIDLKTPTAKSNTTGIMEEGSPFRTSKRKTWNLSSFSTQKSVSQVIDLTTPTTRANTTDVMEYQKGESPFRTTKRKTWNLPTLSTQKSVSQVSDLTPTTKANTTGVMEYQKGESPFRTSKRKTWNLTPFSTQKNVSQGEQQNTNAVVDAEVVMPVSSSTPETLSKLSGAVKTSPKKKFSLHKTGTSMIKKISSKQKSPLHKIEKRVIQKTKMPNFKAIHQNALTKMENIVDMKERKAARAKLLLSGGKPETSMSIKKPGGKSRKALDYHQTDEGSNGMQPSKSENVKSNIPRQTASKPIQKNVEQQLKIQSRIPQASNKPQKIKTEIQKQMKSVATKSKTTHNGLEQRRNAIGNVRLNRRFELLMKMRMK